MTGRRNPGGVVVTERQRCICNDVCFEHCRACNWSMRDPEEPCIADPDWKPDEANHQQRMTALRHLRDPHREEE